MSLRTRTQLLTACVALVVIAVVACFISLRDSAEAEVAGPVSILLNTVTINAPTSGGNAWVTGSMNGSVDYMSIYGRNVTRDNLLNNGTPQWSTLSFYTNPFGTPATFYGNIQAGYGDLLEVKASNMYYSSLWTDIKHIGYVPAGTDTAPPDFYTTYINAAWASNQFTLTLTAYYAIYDPSFPITITLSEEDNPSNKTSLILTAPSGTYPKTMTLSVGSPERLRLRARDNYGNERSMFFITNQLGWSAASSTFQQEPNAAAAERTGNQASAGHGVQLNNGCFVHGETFMHIRGKVLSLNIDGLYRHRLTHDYTLGESWDSILHSRIVVDGSNNVTWFPGNGRVETFLYASDIAPYWVSPFGLPVKMSGVSGIYTLSFANGLKYKYQNNRLVSVEDLNGNKIQLHYDSQGKVFRIIDDMGRFYRIDYFDHGRIAELVDFTGATVVLEYGSQGHLLKIADEANLTRRFEYDAYGRMKKLFDRNDRAFCENSFSTSSRVITQKLPAAASTSYVFDYTNLDTPPATGAHVIVTNPVGSIAKYFVDTSFESPPFQNSQVRRYLLLTLRTEANINLRQSPSFVGYDWQTPEVPVWRELRKQYNYQNYLPFRSWTEWCPGDQGPCAGGANVQKTPYVWYDYNTQAQNASHIDPRRFATLRLLRKDKVVSDEARAGDSIRESWTYESTADYTKLSTYYEPRAWSGMADNYEMIETDPDAWTLPNTFSVSYVYDVTGYGRLVSVNYPNVSQPSEQPVSERTGIATSYTYNASGQLTSSTSANNVVSRYEYYTFGFQKGLLQKQYTDIPGTAADPAETFEYDLLGRAIARTDGIGNRSTRTFDALDRILTDSTPSVTPSYGVLTTTFVYDGENLMEERYPNKDHNGVTPPGEPPLLKTTYEYYPQSSPRHGALWKVNRPVKSSGNPNAPITARTEFEYDAVFNKTRVKTEYKKDLAGIPLYQIADHSFDEQNREVRFIIYMSNPDAAPPNFADDIVGDNYFNARGELAVHTDSDGLNTVWTYDTVGRPVTTDNPDGSSSRTEYHDPSSVSSPVTTQYLVNTNDPSTKLSKTQTLQDELGRGYLRRVFYDLSLPEAPSKYYDEKRWFNKDSQETRRYDYYTRDLYYATDYDGAGRVLRSKSPGGLSEEIYTYDLNNQTTQVEKNEWNEVTLAYVPSVYALNYYDGIGRLYKVRYGGAAAHDQQETRYYLDSSGRERRRTFSSLGLETLTSYDLAGAVTQTKERIDANTWRQTDYTRDYLGRELTRTKENATGTVVYTSKYDAWGNGRMEEYELPALASGVDKHRREFYSNGRLWKEIDPNGTVKEYIYDQATGLITQVNIVPGPAVILGGPVGTGAITYEYTTAGSCSCSGGVVPSKVTTKRNGVIETEVEREYTPLGKLRKEKLSVYDLTENPAQLHTSTLTYVYDYDANDTTPQYNESMYFGDVFINPSAKFIRHSFSETQALIEVSTSHLGLSGGAVMANYKYQGTNKILEREYINPSWGSVTSFKNTAAYDAFGWGKRTTNTWYKTVGGTPELLADWSATYDAANRIATKRIGRIVGGGSNEGEFQFKHDKLGRLTHTYYSLGAGTPGDWSDTDYAWDKAGTPTQQRQLFSTGTGARMDNGSTVTCVPSATGSCVQEDGVATGYTYSTDARGNVTAVSGSRNLAYYDNALSNVARRIGPQTRSIDKNGNTISLDFAWSRFDNPLTDPSGPPYNPCYLEQESRNYSWYYEYDAANRVTFAEKNVTGDWPGCPQTPCPHPYAYTHGYYFVYDGFGRRVFSRFTNSNPGNTQCIQDDSSLPSDFAFLPGNLSLLNVFDKEGRIVQRGNEITYIHGADKIPILGYNGVPGIGDGGGGSVPQAIFFLSDVQGNAAAFADGNGALYGEGNFTDCNTRQVRISTPANPLGSANVYAFDYGDMEPGFSMVDDRNCSPSVIKEDGGMYFTEFKQTAGGGGNAAPPTGKCFIFAFCVTNGDDPNDCTNTKQNMLFLKAYCSAQSRAVDMKAGPQEYMEHARGVNANDVKKSKDAAWESYKTYTQDELAKKPQPRAHDRYFFIAHGIQSGFTFGKAIDVNIFRQDVAQKFANKTMLDTGGGQPEIRVYLPGCKNAAAWQGAGLGLQREKSGEQNIKVYSASGDIAYRGPSNLTGDENDKSRLETYNKKKGKPARYGPAQGDPNSADPNAVKSESPWEESCVKKNRGNKSGTMKSHYDQSKADNVKYGDE